MFSIILQIVNKIRFEAEIRLIIDKWERGLLSGRDESSTPLEVWNVS